MRKVGGNAERAIKECVVLCSVTVACSTASVIAAAALHILLTESLNRGNAQVSFLQNSYGLAECSTKVAWGLYSSYLYLQRWQLLCPPRSIQEALRDTLVPISPLLCIVEKLLLMTI